MRASLWRDRRVLAAAGAVAAAATLLILSVGRVVSTGSPPASHDAGPGSSAPVPPAPDSVDPDRADFMVAVENDPFLPERSPKPTRYRPGDPGPALASAESPVEGEELVVLGVAVLPGGGGVAASRLGAESRLLRIGQQIGPFRLLRVEAGRAVFQSAGGASRTFPVRKPGS